MTRRTRTSCGTPGGYRAHLRRGEVTCTACRQAWNADQRRLTATNPDVRAAKVRYARAQYRALARLRDRHRGEYLRFLDEELRREGAAA